MMDALSTSYKCTNIGSDNEHMSDHQLATRLNSDHAEGLDNCQPSTALTTPGSLQSTEPTTTCT